MRRHPRITPTAVLVLGVALPGAARADLHAGGATIECLDCHVLRTGTFGVRLPRGAEQEAVCQTCHNPTGQAAALSDVAMHMVGDVTVDCGSCHDVHFPQTTSDPRPGGATAPNLRLVRGDTARYVPAALEPAIYQSTPAHFAFAQGAPPYVGVCQTCHTATAYHRNDASSSHSHGMGTACTDCHEHRTGFAASCVGCHAVPQDDGDGVPLGGRRAVLGELPSGTAHAHMRGPAASGEDCMVCHAQATHADGHVDLIDPDTGAITRFATVDDLVGDPDLSDFCAACHDADGAARLASPHDPFGNGSAPAEVASRFAGTLEWSEAWGSDCFGPEGTGRAGNSHHDISDADQAFSGARIECTSCHSAHGASAATPLADPRAPTTPFGGTTSEHCLVCHEGGAGPQDPGAPPGVVFPTVKLDAQGQPCAGGPGCEPMSALRPLESCDYGGAPWYSDYTWTHEAHGLDSKRGWTGYSGAPGAVLDCTVCHDPHGSATPDHPAGNPYLIRDTVDGTPFVDDGIRQGKLWTGPPWTTTGVVRDVRLTVPPPGPVSSIEWGGATGLCSACHASWEQAYGWHTYCGGCQTCHGHGQAFGATDFVSGQDTACIDCGNGVVQGLEQCDDGNQVDGDGCSNECSLE